MSFPCLFCWSPCAIMQLFYREASAWAWAVSSAQLLLRFGTLCKKNGVDKEISWLWVSARPWIPPSETAIQLIELFSPHRLAVATFSPENKASSLQHSTLPSRTLRCWQSPIRITIVITSEPHNTWSTVKYLLDQGTATPASASDLEPAWIWHTRLAAEIKSLFTSPSKISDLHLCVGPSRGPQALRPPRQSMLAADPFFSRVIPCSLVGQCCQDLQWATLPGGGAGWDLETPHFPFFCGLGCNTATVQENRSQLTLSF